jgi:hypothetical protein
MIITTLICLKDGKPIRIKYSLVKESGKIERYMELKSKSLIENQNNLLKNLCFSVSKMESLVELLIMILILMLKVWFQAQKIFNSRILQ